MSILGIDYGTRRIGLAISIGSFAEPLKIIANSESTFSELLQICKENSVTEIVVGLSEGEMAKETEQFAKQLSQHLDLPISFFDESFSSRIVQQKLISAQTSQKKRRQPIDHFASAQMLQEYLDSSQ